MPDLSSPISNCMTPPCYSLGDILQGAAFVVGALLALVLILFVTTRIMGGRTVRSAADYEAPSGAYGLSKWTNAVINVLPRPWRDDTFYEQLQPDASTVARAGAAVAIAAVVVALPGVAVDSLSGNAGGGIARLVTSAIAAVLVWLAVGAIASGVAGLFFGRREGLLSLVAGLGFALTPLALFALGFWPALGLPVFILAGSWTLVLCYLAARATVKTDEVQSFGILVSVVLAGFVLWQVTQSAFRPGSSAEVAACDGLVDGSGACVPLAELPPSIQTAIATARIP